MAFRRETSLSGNRKRGSEEEIEENKKCIRNNVLNVVQRTFTAYAFLNTYVGTVNLEDAFKRLNRIRRTTLACIISLGIYTLQRSGCKHP